MSARDEAAGGVELLPCPFCGGAPTMEPWHGGRPTKVRIACPGVFANSVMGHGQKVTCKVAPGVTGETPKLAAKAWNTRSPSPRDQACSAMLGALESVALRPARYNGNTIEIEADSHWDGIQRMLDARKAIDLARSAGIETEENG